MTSSDVTEEKIWTRSQDPWLSVDPWTRPEQVQPKGLYVNKSRKIDKAVEYGNGRNYLRRITYFGLFELEDWGIG